MAVEIQKQIGLYLPKSSQENWAKLLLEGDNLLKGNTNLSNNHFIVHNFEHNMESIFWLLLWTLLVCFPCKLDCNEERSEFAGILSEIFQDMSICSSTCEGVFSQDGTLDDILTKFLAPEFKPTRP